MSRSDLAAEHKVLKFLRSGVHLPKSLLLAVSGGIDSMAMVEILSRWQRHLKIDLALAHVHHGLTDDTGQSRFRTQALAHVRELACRRGLAFYSNPAVRSDLRSEEELRDFRREWLCRWQRESGADAIGLAHHRNDLLETRVFRLIRGTGPEGLRAMSLFRDGMFRPLLCLSRGEIEAYARTRRLNWLDDPSNIKVDAFRNWIRKQWLPQLEQRQAGAVEALARSLEVVAAAGSCEAKEFESESPIESPDVGLRRKPIQRLPQLQREAHVARYFKALRLKGYSQAHVRELLKRLDTDRKNFEFEMLGLRFIVTPDLVSVSRV
ncbi:MAG: tRNA lysidine(34) synthetase TilS [Bdellovibrionales bacterium]